MQKNNIAIYTDGACSGNPGIGGWGAVLLIDKKQIELGGGERKTTNNKMELSAVIKALDYFEEKSVLDIFTDSMYVKNGITVWTANWVKNGWKTAQGKDVKNKKLWQDLLSLNQKHEVSWYWVKGHADNKFNNLADKLAREQIQKIKEKERDFFNK